MSKPPQSIVGIDLGNHSLKAVRLQKQGNQYILARVAYLETGRDPVNPATPTEQQIGNQLKEVGNLVKAAGADVHFSVNSPNSTVRYVELPQIPLEEIRSALKLNSTMYLRQNFDNFTFDACPLDDDGVAALMGKKGKKGGTPGTTHGKVKILAGGISSTEVILFYHASRRAGIKPRSLQLAPISLINGFEVACPEDFAQHAVALLDLGYLSSSLTILDKGKPLLTRAVPVGGKQITEYIAQMSNLDFAKAEAAKIQGDPSLGEAVARVAVTLIREVRSSINFFEKNSDQAISKVYLTGASMASPAVVEALNKDIGSPCEAWNVSQGLTIQLPPEQQAIFSRNEFAFSTALGAARTYAVLAAPEAVPAKAAPAKLGESTVQPPPPATE